MFGIPHHIVVLPPYFDYGATSKSNTALPAVESGLLSALNAAVCNTRLLVLLLWLT